jgi:uncharacterized UPF0160 family protein
MIIATHDGTFHADDVFAVAMLLILYPKATVIRTRNLDLLKGADIRVDVGLKYDPPTDFDHHQFACPTRSDDSPYAAAGLVALHFQDRLFQNEEVYEIVDQNLIAGIDAVDNGINIYRRVDPYKVYDIHSVIATFGHTTHEQRACKPDANRRMQDKAFMEAVKFADHVLMYEIARAESTIEDREITRRAIQTSQQNDPRLIILKTCVAWTEEVVRNAPDAQFVVFYDELSDDWAIQTIPRGSGFTSRCLLPKHWAGLENSEIIEVTGVMDAIFCHKARFFAKAKTKEGILALAEQALKE